MKGFVRKRKDGRWEGRVELPPDTDGNRRRKYVYADRRQECQRMVNELIYKLETSDFADAGRLTVNAYLEKWFEVYKQHLAGSTAQGYRNYVFNHMLPYFGQTKIKELKPIHIEQFYNVERKKYKEKTVLQTHHILSIALQDAVKNNLITKNPCALVKAPSPDEYEITVPDLSVYFAILNAAVGTEHEIPILLAGMCGLRREEVFGLTWNDIDFQEATLTIRQVVTTKEKNQLDIKTPKTRLSARTISIPEDVLAVLAERKSVGYVASQDGSITHPNNYSNRFKNFLKNHKLPHIRFHDLRHFHATLLMEAGVPLKHIQARMGHSTLQMAAHYQHVVKKSDTVVLEKLSAHIKKKISPGGQSGGQTQISQQ